MKKLIFLLILVVSLSGCTKNEEITTSTTTLLLTTTVRTMSIIEVTSTGFPRLKPVLNEITMRADGTFNGTFVNTASYPIKLLEINGQCRFQYNKSQIASYERFGIVGRYCDLPGGGGDRYAMPLDITYLVLTPGPVNRYTDHGTLRGSIEGKNG